MDYQKSINWLEIKKTGHLTIYGKVIIFGNLLITKKIDWKSNIKLQIFIPDSLYLSLILFKKKLCEKVFSKTYEKLCEL